MSMFTDLFTSDRGSVSSVGGELRELQRRAVGPLDDALTAIGVKDIMHLRSLTEVSLEVEASGVAIACLTANLDKDAGALGGALPERKWASAQVLMQQPASFLGLLRKFPYAVEHGQVPEANVAAASITLAGLEEQMFANEPAALLLFRWAVAARSYHETVTQGASSVGVSLTSQASMDMSPLGAPTLSMEQADEASSLQIKSPAQRPVWSGAADDDLATPPRPSNSKCNAAQGAAPRTPGSTGRSPGGGPQASMKRSQDRAAKVGALASPAKKPPSPAMSSNVGRPVSNRQQMAVRPPGGTLATSTVNKFAPPGGYPVGPGSSNKMGMEEFRREIDKIKRDARELKARGSEASWVMKRQEDKARKDVKVVDQREHMDWQQAQSKILLEEVAAQKKAQRIKDLDGSKERAGFKREIKADMKQTELHKQTEEYIETREQSEHTAELLRRAPLEDMALKVESNHEKYMLQKEHRTDEAARAKDTMQLDRQFRDQQAMAEMLRQAQEERQLAEQDYKRLMAKTQ